MTPDPTGIPVCDMSNPGDLESWYGPYGWCEHIRKSVLSMCAELIRAESVAEGVKLSESRVSDLAHTHDLYMAFHAQTLHGKRLRQQNVYDSIEGGGMPPGRRR